MSDISERIVRRIQALRLRAPEIKISDAYYVGSKICLDVTYNTENNSKEIVFYIVQDVFPLATFESKNSITNKNEKTITLEICPEKTVLVFLKAEDMGTFEYKKYLKGVGNLILKEDDTKTNGYYYKLTFPTDEEMFLYILSHTDTIIDR